MLRPLLLGLAALFAPIALAAPALDPATLAIPHQRFTLDNGLTVIVHEDHAVPIVAVNVWYQVGSRDERPGRTGFAHLFEHFFFNGSENYPHGFREAMDDLGANNRNGTTNTDRTNFFEDVPVSALERTLYLEADRMGFLAGHISEAMLERERGVVQNEKRQGENQPYGQVFSRMVEQIYPAGHPYSWSTIGRMEDLQAAHLDDIRAWYAQYYGPGNAVLVLAGDITLERARELVVKYFGAIKPGVPLARLQSAVPTLAAPIRDRMQDRVPQTRLYQAWHLPPLGSREVHAMELLASILAGSESARLDRALRFERGLVTDIGVFVWGKQLTSTLLLQASLAKGAQLGEVEQAINAQLAEIIEHGPAADELERARSRLLAEFARGIERLGGMGGRSDVLAWGQALLGDSEAYQRRLQDLAAIDADEVRAAAQRWLSQPNYTLSVEPFPSLAAGAEQIDRSQLPALAAPPEVRFPEVQRFALDNGLQVMLLQRAAPLLNLSLAVDAGSASDAADRPGRANLALNTLLTGTEASDVYAIADRRDALGASFETSTTLDLSLLRMRALKPRLVESLDLLAELATRPRFDTGMVELQRKEQLAAINQQQASPVGAALRLAPRLLYGDGHPYAQPWGGLGTSASVAALDSSALRDWHQRWFVPGNATLVVVGDVDAAQLRSALNNNFARWKGAERPRKSLPAVAAAGTEGASLILIDKPGAQQSVIVAGHLTSAGGAADDLALESVLRNFGGMATSRLNRNLRLEKHWSYGASGGVYAARGPRPFLVIAPVQTDKTAEAMREVLAEIRGVASARPLQGEEFDSVLRSQIARLPARFETLDALAQAAFDVIAVNRDPAYYYRYAEAMRALDAEELNAAAAAAVKPDQLRWIVIGDLSKVRAPIDALGWGTSEVLADPQ